MNLIILLQRHTTQLFPLLLALVLLPLTGIAMEAEQKHALSVFAPAGSPPAPLAGSLPGLILLADSGVDYIELGVAATSDGTALITPDIDLCKVTDAQSRFPEKVLENKSCPSFLFTLSEIRQLRKQATLDFPSPTDMSMPVPTLSEFLALHLHLEQEYGKSIGLIPRLLSPAAHLEHDIDLPALCVKTLQQFGYTGSRQRLMLQSRDADALQRIHKELLPAMGIDIPLIQRIEKTGENSGSGSGNQSWMFTRIGVRLLASYAKGVAIDVSLLHDQNGIPSNQEFAANLDTLGLPVYGFITQESQQALPPFAANQDALYSFYFTKLGLDGLSTPLYPELVEYLKTNEQQETDQELPPLPLNPLPTRY